VSDFESGILVGLAIAAGMIFFVALFIAVGLVITGNEEKE
jgi:hypothetical protein